MPLILVTISKTDRVIFCVSISKLILSVKLCAIQGISHLFLFQVVRFLDWTIFSKPEFHVGKGKEKNKYTIEW